MREREFIEWIRSRSDFDPAIVPVGPGDDCAVVAFGGNPGAPELLVTTDQTLDGVHFVLAEHGPAAAGRKAMARSLSDVAAMAALPFGAVATVALPKGASHTDGEAVYQGLRGLGDQFDCPLVGGDVAGWDGRLAISVTVFAAAAGVEPVLRSGARVGDAVCVTGSFGGAWRSRRHLAFTPRIREARVLAGEFKLRAMIDVSDGLSADLLHVCRASAVGAEITAEAVPAHPEAPDIAAALDDGEDYELLFTLPVDQAKRLIEDQPLDVPVTRIGTIVAGRQLSLVWPDGRGDRLKGGGWEHET